jgi:hypothetical protein
MPLTGGGGGAFSCSRVCRAGAGALALKLEKAASAQGQLNHGMWGVS